MSCLIKFLAEEELKEVIETYTKEVIQKLDNDNIGRILNYLVQSNVSYWKDILILYLDIFLIPYKEFVRKFEILKKVYGIEYIGEHLQILEKMVN